MEDLVRAEDLVKAEGKVKAEVKAEGKMEDQRTAIAGPAGEDILPTIVAKK